MSKAHITISRRMHILCMPGHTVARSAMSLRLVKAYHVVKPSPFNGHWIWQRIKEINVVANAATKAAIDSL